MTDTVTTMRAVVLDASGVHLTGYSGESADLPVPVLQSFLDDVAAGRAVVPIDRVFELDRIGAAHTLMESGQARGKLVVLPWT
jgi:NADPH2:quinone reductase